MTNGEGLPTMAEVLRRVDRLEREMATSLARIEARLDARVMSVDVYQAEKLAMQIQLGNADRRIGTLEEARVAIGRLLLGALLGVIGDTLGLLIVYVVTRK